ncbi:MAG: beta-galactosidase, partial [Patescibacteria group bacterium]|nr:beta-galactosidase [Patescibacteria group bacterium]
AKLLLVIGMKTGRWPECHIPDWLLNQKSKIKNQKLLEYIEKLVNRYKNSKAIWAWQIENEPFFPFGECPKISKSFLKKEIDLVKSIDERPVIISDSGEFSFWITAAKLGDIVGTTLHRRVWVKELKIYLTHYWFRPIYYWRKAQIIKKLFNKKVICVELQAEPWGPKLLYDLPIEEQEKTMNLKIFKENIEFAKKTGLDQFYLWGAEWWYWLKEKQNKPEFWREAKKLFQNNS